VSSNPPAWKLLIDPTISKDDRISLMKSIFSDHDEAEVFKYLSRRDAQAFVDVMGKASICIHRIHLRTDWLKLLSLIG